jgi:hypothetical protein
VDRKSAVLGLPGTRERQIPIDADHRTICKFADPEDPRYKLVEDNIVQMISGAIPASHRYVDTRPPIRLGKSNRIIGHSYTVTQVGNATGSKTAGNENETDQYRDSLKCDISGARNTTAQVSAGATWVCCHDSAADG